MKNENISLELRNSGRWNWKTIGISVCVAFTMVLAVLAINSKMISSQFNVYYSLNTRHNDQELIKVIDDANKYVYFAIYFFTKNSIADALIRAKNRGVDVIGIMDRDASLNSNAKILERLGSANIQILTQRHPEGIMHIKALVTEDAYASGSYNWTDSANNVNDEVLEIGTNESVRKQYLAIIKKILTINNN
jgi:phosphatidylserine/phosphatidylglycerophosphate/cardiolipin synthase-like enzyme